MLHGAVLTAEDGEIWIGDDVVIVENALVRSRSRYPVSIGTAVLVGPHAHLNGTTVEDEVFIATGASLFPGSVAARGSELRINSVLHVNTRLMPETIIPIGWIAAGNPAQLFSPDQHEELWQVQSELDFPGTVSGVPRATPMPRSGPGRPSSTALIETTRSSIINDCCQAVRDGVPRGTESHARARASEGLSRQRRLSSVCSMFVIGLPPMLSCTRKAAAWKEQPLFGTRTSSSS